MEEQNRFCHLRLKRQRYLNSIDFLIKCKKKRIIPKFIQMSCNLKRTIRTSRALKNCHFVMLRAVIQDHRKSLARIEEELYPLHLEVTAKGTVIEQIFEDNSFCRAHFSSEMHRQCLRKKLSSLSEESLDKDDDVTKNFLPVINLSGVTLSKAQMDVLELGTNFSNPPKYSPTKIIPQLEKSVALSKISAGQKESLRHLLAESLKHNSKLKQKPSLSYKEKEALASLKENKDLVITKADKGGRIVVMDKSEYVNLVEEHISQGPYTLLSEDPSDSHLKDLREGVKGVHSFNKGTKKRIIPSVTHCARFYGLPKVHKPALSIRPVVSGIGTAAHIAAKELVSILSCTKAMNSFTIPNSAEFAKHIRTQIPGDSIMLSFDVVSMFTNVPIDGAIECLRSRLKAFHFSQGEVDEISHLTEICVKQTAFTFNGKLYAQREGLAMGNPLSPVLCDIYMHYLEEKIMKKFKFSLWQRYVDDIFVIWNGVRENVPQLLDEINSMNQNIQFTVEIEENNCLPFLDVLVIKNRDCFLTEVYRKPFAVSLPPHARSAHPMHQKISAFHSFIHRAFEISSDDDALTRELDTIKEIAVSRGFSPGLIENMLKKKSRPRPDTTLQPFEVDRKDNKAVIPYFPKISQKLSSIFKIFGFRTIYKPVGKFDFKPPKDSIPDEKRFGIYSISCKDCPKFYIGQTRRNLKFRVTEHRRYVRKKQLTKSSIAQHCWENSHNFDFDTAEIFHKLPSTEFLNFFEAWHIHNSKIDLVNDSKATPHLSSAWVRMLPNSA